MIRFVISFGMLLSAFAVSADAALAQKLTDALLCKTGSDNPLHALVEKGSNFQHGYAAYGFGEDMSYKEIVILAKPLRIGVAQTSAVIWDVSGSYFNFGGIISARFKGDYRKIVALLMLERSRAPKNESIGKYVSRQAPADQCPPTIILTPSETNKNEFLLGCGWCNGG